MTINVSKTKHMLFYSAGKCRLTDEAILINGEKLDNVKNYNYLGISLDSQLNLDSFINNITKKVANKIVMISKVIQKINKDVALLIYKQMILPYMDYLKKLWTNYGLKKISAYRPSRPYSNIWSDATSGLMTDIIYKNQLLPTSVGGYFALSNNNYYAHDTCSWQQLWRCLPSPVWVLRNAAFSSLK